jgi:hypothetical protein
MNAQKGILVDHRNGNGLDNRRINLRLCTDAQNRANRRLQRNNKSGFKGVFLNAKNGKFLAHVQVNKKTFYLGSFVSPIDAAKAYDKAAKLHFGEFARLNFDNTNSPENSSVGVQN